MEQFIAALDLGTSKIIAMIAKKNLNDALSILHVEKVSSETAIKRGSVHNRESVSRKISEIIQKLNAQISPSNQTIEKIYVGIGGQALHSEQYILKKEVEGGTVTTELIDAIEEEQLQNRTDNIRESFPPEYYLDGELEPHPVGSTGTTIEARFQLIWGHPLAKLKEAIEEKTKVQVADFFVTPLATAEAVLREDEKKSGCALVELGAGLTYVSIYKDDVLKYLATIPLGGAAITKDICSLDISLKEAEAFKINYGSAVAGTEEPEDGSEQSSETGEFKLKKVVEARVAEILANVKEQIRLSGYEQSIGKIVITGGGASLKDLPEAIKDKTGKDVRLAIAKKSLVNQAPEWSQQPANASVIGLLTLGTANCLKKKEVVIPRPSVTQTSFLPNDSEIESNSKEEREKREKERREREKAERAEKERKDRERKEKAKEAQKAQKGPSLFGRLFEQVEKVTVQAADALLNPDKEAESNNNTQSENTSEDKNDNKK
jgi:cell division protein FtsA